MFDYEKCARILAGKFLFKEVGLYRSPIETLFIRFYFTAETMIIINQTFSCRKYHVCFRLNLEL